MSPIKDSGIKYKMGGEMISEGAWIAIAVTIGGGFGTAITALIKREPKSNASGFDYKKCTAHSGIVSEIGSLSDGLKRIEKNQKELWDAMDEVRGDVKNLPLTILKMLEKRERE